VCVCVCGGEEEEEERRDGMYSKTRTHTSESGGKKYKGGQIRYGVARSKLVHESRYNSLAHSGSYTG